MSSVVAELKRVRQLLEATTGQPAELLDRPAMASALSIGVSTLDRMKAARLIGPPEIRVGGAVRWHRVEVLAWLAHPTPAGELFDAKAWPPIWAELQRRNAKR